MLNLLRGLFTSKSRHRSDFTIYGTNPASGAYLRITPGFNPTRAFIESVVQWADVDMDITCEHFMNNARVTIFHVRPRGEKCIGDVELTMLSSMIVRTLDELNDLGLKKFAD
jgi:hypothetical protein